MPYNIRTQCDDLPVDQFKRLHLVFFHKICQRHSEPHCLFNHRLTLPPLRISIPEKIRNPEDQDSELQNLAQRAHSGNQSSWLDPRGPKRIVCCLSLLCNTAHDNSNRKAKCTLQFCVRKRGYPLLLNVSSG